MTYDFERLLGFIDEYAPTGETPAGPRTMLIIDDDAINRAVLANIFAEHYVIEEVGDGDAGLDLILADPVRYCSVLLDYQMERMDGLEVLRQLSSRGLTRRVPVFLISAEANAEVTRAAYELGVMDVIEKPVVPYVVQRRVGSVVELFAARRRLRGVVERQQTELLRRATQIIELNQGMIEALAAAIEFRDGESGGHVRRIHDITRIVLTETDLGSGLGPSEIASIALASIMHDVGKIAIPDAILGKPGKLTAEEFEVMKTHTVIGAQMLEGIPQLRQSGTYGYAVDIARHHHERWDGRGYPDGIGGSDLSVWSQVTALADVYDALRSKRVYKGALGRRETAEMITGGACGTFNPQLLSAFAEVEPLMSTMYEPAEGGTQ